MALSASTRRWRWSVGHTADLPVPATEVLALLASRDRILAEPVRADRDQPPFDRSTRDGFAVRASEFGASTLRIVGQVRAGEQWEGAALEKGAAIEIMTGAPVPEGADAVVMVEHVDRGRRNDPPQSATGQFAPGRILSGGEVRPGRTKRY